MVPTARHRYRHATPELVARARQLRREGTPAERILWEALRGRQLQGMRFRRQHPIETFILDFYCPQHKLVVEVDGGIHTEPTVRERDEERQRWIEARDSEPDRSRPPEHGVLVVDRERVATWRELDDVVAQLAVPGQREAVVVAAHRDFELHPGEGELERDAFELTRPAAIRGG